MKKEQSKNKEKKLKANKKLSPSDFKAQAEEYLSGWQRAQADYQNLKKE